MGLLACSARADDIVNTFNADGSMPARVDGNHVFAGWDGSDDGGSYPVLQVFSLNEGIELSSFSFAAFSGVNPFGDTTTHRQVGLYSVNRAHPHEVYTPLGVHATFTTDTSDKVVTVAPNSPVTLNPGAYAILITGGAPTYVSGTYTVEQLVYQQSRATIPGADPGAPWPIAIRTNPSGERIMSLATAVHGFTEPTYPGQSTLRYQDGGQTAATEIDQTRTLVRHQDDLLFMPVLTGLSPEANGPLVMKLEGTRNGVLGPQVLPEANRIHTLDGQQVLRRDAISPNLSVFGHIGTDYQTRATSFTATDHFTEITFAVGGDQTTLALANVRVTPQGGSGNLIVNGDFSAETAPNGPVSVTKLRYLEITGSGAASVDYDGVAPAPAILNPTGWTFTNGSNAAQEAVAVGVIKSILAQSGYDGMELQYVVDNPSAVPVATDSAGDPIEFIWRRAKDVEINKGVVDDSYFGHNAYQINSLGGYSFLTQVIPTVPGETYDLSYDFRSTFFGYMNNSNGLPALNLSGDVNLLAYPTTSQTFNIDNIAVYAAGAPGLPGDFDLDGDVDGHDFLLWQRGESPDPLSAADLADWQTYFGAPGSLASSASVPEPGSLTLLATLSYLCFRQSKRRSGSVAFLQRR